MFHIIFLSNPFPYIRLSQIKLPVPTLSPSESLLRTDSLSSAEPVLSDGSVGSAPSLGLSPGPSSAMDINRSEVNLTPEEMMKNQHKAVEVKTVYSPVSTSDCSLVILSHNDRLVFVGIFVCVSMTSITLSNGMKR